MAETELQRAIRQLKKVREKRTRLAKQGLTSAVEALDMEIDVALDYILELKKKTNR